MEIITQNKRIEIEKGAGSHDFVISSSAEYFLHVTEGGDYSFSFHIKEGVTFSLFSTIFLNSHEKLSFSLSIFHESSLSSSDSLVRGVAKKGSIFYKAYTGVLKDFYNTNSTQDAQFLLAGGSVSGLPALGPSSFTHATSHSFSCIPLSSAITDYYILKGWTEEEAENFLMKSFLEKEI